VSLHAAIYMSADEFCYMLKGEEHFQAPWSFSLELAQDVFH
jgi:hypothetical protein